MKSCNLVMCMLFFPSYLYAAGSINESIDRFVQTKYSNQSGIDPTLELEAFADKKLGKLNTRFMRNNFTYFLSVQGVIDENTQEGLFADLDGLKNGNKVALKVEYWPNSTEVMSKLYGACNGLAIKKNNLVKKYTSSNCPLDDDKKDSMSQDCKAIDTEIKNTPTSCQEAITNTEAMNNLMATVPALNPHRFALGIAYSNDKLEWFDDKTLAINKDSKDAYSIEATYSYFNRKYQRFNLAFRHEVAWQSMPKNNICIPLSQVAGAQSCQEKSLGTPKKQESEIAYLEFETYLGRSDRFAVAPKVSYDFDTDVTGIDVPLYLYQTSTDSGLKGGIRLGWRSDTDDTTTSLFFSKKFSISE